MLNHSRTYHRRLLRAKNARFAARRLAFRSRRSDLRFWCLSVSLTLTTNPFLVSATRPVGDPSRVLTSTLPRATRSVALFPLASILQTPYSHIKIYIFKVLEMHRFIKPYLRRRWAY